jgi:PPOX class probable F420-dependent enzyme
MSCEKRLHSARPPRDAAIKMAGKLTEEAIRLIEERNIAHLATLMPDGSPQVTPVWIDHQGDLILINTAVGRVKQRNCARGARVALSIAGQENPYDKIMIRGRVIAQTSQGAEAHIDKLAKKYTGAAKYQKSRPDERRIIIKIEPIAVVT